MITYKLYSKNITQSYEEKTQEKEKRSISKTKTILEAKLRFKDEVAPKDRQDIIDRLYGKVYGKNQKQGMLSEFPLDGYLYQTEKIVHNPLNGNYQDTNYAKERKIKIKKRKFRLGLDIKIVSPYDIEFSEMLNLETLNKFILTGK